MEHFDYKDILKISAFLYKYRKAFNLAKIRRLIKRDTNKDLIKKIELYMDAFQRLIVIPLIFLSIITVGWIYSILYLLRTNNIYGALGMMILSVIIAFTYNYLMRLVTPKVKLKLIISEA